MKKQEAYTVSIGLLAVLDTYLTATVWHVPVWVTFIAWASFFIVGGGKAGFVRSVASNLTGLVISSLVLLGIATVSEAPFFIAIAVGAGSALMVQASKVPLLSILPAIVWGFASTVGTTAVGGKPMTTPGLENPALIAAGALITGAVFGYVSEWLGDALTSKPRAQLA
ncbi:hypothetical protein M2401_004638 [Pseudomonas sp. JUb42]|jgi:hypothetical protein|uniref:DUF1097 domain-containing protein n=1 Tax=Pseudomonas sp. JUb42 TaxID=2940611 RepID=UPI0021682D59|nr:DUF1097 domain-containing protein [Pseudomonas sp. JUb42]MCS3470880.1 hypothetical protein [Pseudomonas sp. JUb42]